VPIITGETKMRIASLLTIVMVLMVSSVGSANAVQVGTRDNPIPMGDSGKLGDLKIRVLSFNPDADKEMVSRYKENHRAQSGNVLLLISVEVTYLGNDVERPDALQYSFVGDSNAALPNVSCYTYMGSGVHDEALTADLFPGGSSQFERCIEAPKSELSSLLFYVSDRTGNRVFFELNAMKSATPTR